MIDIKWVIILTLFFEFLTIFARFIFKMSSKENYIWVMKKLKLKFFIHMHHGIIGAIVVIIAFFYPVPFLMTIGLAMFFSDAIHHFLVLYYVIGHPEFHVVYKNIKMFEKEQREEHEKMNAFMKHIIHHTNLFAVTLIIGVRAYLTTLLNTVLAHI